jgi:hypothetical protein
MAGGDVSIAPIAPPAPADRVKQLLAQGKTAQQAADLTGWPRARVVALINAVHGWLLDHKTDTVYQPDNPGRLPRLPEGTAPITHEVPAKAAVTKGSIDALLTEAAGLDDKTVQRHLAKTTEAIGALREAVRTVAARTAAEHARQQRIAEARAEVETLERELAEAKARARQLGVKKTAPATARPPAGGPSPKDIRAWAASAGVDCSPNGRIPAGVRAAYDQAHGGDQ